MRLTQFRGFSDLTIQNIPRTARLVMLIGPNGTGKSSIFDALMIWSGAHSVGINWDRAFHVKHSAPPEAQQDDWSQKIKNVELYEGDPIGEADWKKVCYFRSAYRNEVEFSGGNFGSLPELAARSFNRMIENDTAVATNYRRLVLNTVKDVWEENPRRSETLRQYADAVVAAVNSSLERVLPHLRLQSLGNPSTADGNFYFSKGISTGYPFKNLSGGEKAVFDLLIDLIVKLRYFDSSVVCIDEPETHVNPIAHGPLLKELHHLVSGERQLWVATHAVGMLRAARDIEAAAPGTVAFVDFEGDFDKPVTLEPTRIDRATWERSLSVALADLSSLVAPKRIVVCEGGTAPISDAGVDGQTYNRIFAEKEPDTTFFSAGSHTDTEHARRVLGTLSSTVLTGIEVRRLIDRDDKSDVEVESERKKGALVLSRRNLEAYLFSDELIRRLCENNGKPEVADRVITLRDTKIAEKKAAVDDYKAAAGETYVALKRELGLKQSGNDTHEFMRETLAPLVTPDTAAFKDLYRDIFQST
jgi:predicted ATPase